MLPPHHGQPSTAESGMFCILFSAPCLPFIWPSNSYVISFSRLGLLSSAMSAAKSYTIHGGTWHTSPVAVVRPLNGAPQVASEKMALPVASWEAESHGIQNTQLLQRHLPVPILMTFLLKARTRVLVVMNEPIAFKFTNKLANGIQVDTYGSVTEPTSTRPLRYFRPDLSEGVIISLIVCIYVEGAYILFSIGKNVIWTHQGHNIIPLAWITGVV